MNAQQRRLVAFVFGVLACSAAIGLYFFDASRLSDVQVDALRVLMALGAGGIVAFFPGDIELRISSWLRAGGAMAVFALVFFYGPGTRPTVVGRPSHEGYLGVLLEALQRNVPEERFLLVLDPSYDRELRAFFVKGEVAGETWAEVVSKICRAHRCLICEPQPGRITNRATISLTSADAVKYVSEGSEGYYRCL